MLSRLKRLYLGLKVRFNMGFGWFRSLFRFRSSYIVERWTGVDGGALGSKICIFVHFDRRGEIHDYVLFYLRALKSCGFSIVFVSNAPKLTKTAVEQARGLVSVVLRRKNIGYDFGAYKDGIGALPDLDKCEQLLLANDSVYGPFSSLTNLFGRIDPARAQFWGLTDCWDVAYHLQSYFLLFTNAALHDASFRKFWRKVRYVNAKDFVIRKYEVGLSQTLMKAGLRGAALCNYREAAQAVVDAVRDGALQHPTLDEHSKEYLEHLFNSVRLGVPLNLSHFLWDYLIVEMGCPFIKRELLQRNPASVPYISRWQQVIRSVSDYDTDLIVRHLQVTLKNRFV